MASEMSPLQARTSLDDVDQMLLHLLTQDGRASNRSLAAEAGITEATVAARLRRLMDEGVLAITCVFDREAAGWHWYAHVAMRVEGRPIAAVAAAMASAPYVVGVATVFDQYDLVAAVATSTRHELMTAITTGLGAIKGVAESATWIELECVQMRWGYASLPAKPRELEFPDPVVSLDPLDHEVLALLVQDGRQSNREIARQLDVSEGTVRIRLRRLEESGLMRIVAQIDPAAAGTISTIAYVGIDVEGSRRQHVVDWLSHQPEAAMVSVTAGRHPVLALVAAPSRERLVKLVGSELRGIKGVRRTETWEVVDIAHHVYQWVRFLD